MANVEKLVGIESPLEVGQKINEIIEKGGAGSYIGQTIFSLDPLYEDGLHLFDGSVLDDNGIYANFISTYIANLYAKHPERFITEDEWQTQVDTYGVCGRYVYDTDANTVRLPKVTGFVEGTLDVAALGDLVEAGLPNIEGYVSFTPLCGSSAHNLTSSGAFSKSVGTRKEAASASGSIQTYNQIEIELDASDSNTIYSNSDTVQPQSIKGYLYMVVASGSKSELDINFDNISVDLNNKVDKHDMVEATVVVETYQNGSSWYRVYSDGWCEQGGSISADGTVYFLKELQSDWKLLFASVTSSNKGIPRCTAKYTNGFDYGSATVADTPCDWEAKGYLA